MSSSESLAKRANKASSKKVSERTAKNKQVTTARKAKASVLKPVPEFDLFYQLTYMSAIAAAGITRSKLFVYSATPSVSPAIYFRAVNRLVDEFRYDYPEACRRVGIKASSENMRSFLLRLSDALRSGEPMADYLAREAEAQAQEYENHYERKLEALKQWTNAFSSIVISVALIIIIQLITSMIYSTDITSMLGLVFTGVTMSGFAAWIIWRSAPQEVLVMPSDQGSEKQRKAMRMFRTIGPVSIMLAMVLMMLGVSSGTVLILTALILLPIGMNSMSSDREVVRKDVEFATFLRSVGGMATSSGSTLKEALLRLDLSSFPHLRKDIERLGRRLQARIDPQVCWRKFGSESGSRLISDVVELFYGAITVGGDPERTGYLCAVFSAKTSQLRAKRRMVTGTFSALTTVMMAVVSVLMVFVLSIVTSFAIMVAGLMPESDEMSGQPQMSLGMAEFSAADLQFLSTLTLSMLVMLALVSAAAIILSDGGNKLKVTFWMALTMFIAGISYLVVPPMVSGLLTG